MEAVALNAQSRSELRRTRVKKIRASGLLPGVLYGCQKDPKPLTVCAKDFERMVKHSASENLLVKLAVEGDGVRLGVGGRLRVGGGGGGGVVALVIIIIIIIMTAIVILSLIHISRAHETREDMV